MGEVVTDVQVSYNDSSADETYKATNVVGATASYPYWVIWEPEMADGRQTCHFIPKEFVRKVTMTGLPEEEEEKKNNLVSLKGGKDAWANIEE